MKTNAIIYSASHAISPTAASRHLAICVPKLRPVMVGLGCKPLPGDRYDVVDLWRRMWGIDRVPIPFVQVMQRPLLSVESVAEMVGVHPLTIRRAGNVRSPKWALPEHVDLGPRLRRYLPLHIEAWLRGDAPEEWLRRRHGLSGPLGLRLKRPFVARNGGVMSN